MRFSALLEGRRRLVMFSALMLVCLSAIAPSAIAQPAAPSRPAPDDQLSSLLERSIALCRGRAEPSGVAPFFRTELYFGSNKPDGSAVTPEEFQRFVDNEITPRFPDGLTLLTGLGQFRGSSGVIQKERSMLLILLYPVDTARRSGEKIEQIRTAYERAFQQESVLRADEPLPECVSF
jgi:hypothetical protein